MTGIRQAIYKEWVQQIRSYRLHATIAAFLIVGIGSPLLAAFLPELLNRLPVEKMHGFEFIMIRKPDATDALLQFQRNQALLPILIIIANMASVGEEIRNQSAQSLLSLPLARTAFVVAKFLVPSAIYIVTFWVAYGCCYLYIRVLFGEIDLAGFVFVGLLFCLSYLGYLAVTLAVSATGAGSGKTAGIALGIYLVLSAIGGMSVWLQWTPGGLSAAAESVISSYLIYAPTATVFAGMAFIFLSMMFAILRFLNLPL